VKSVLPFYPKKSKQVNFMKNDVTFSGPGGLLYRLQEQQSPQIENNF
jgi:hypothetical protein